MKKIKRTVIIALATTFVGAFTLGLTSCVKEEEVTSKVNGAVNPVKTEISTINGYIDELEEKAQGLETKLTAVDTAIAEADGELDEVTKLLDDTKTLLEGEIAEIKTEIKALKAEDSEILTAISTITGKIQTLESNIEKLNGNVTALAERVSKNETDIADVLERLETLEKENAIMKACLNGDHETEASYVWSETACTATLACEHCAYRVDEEGTVYALGEYKEATFTNELFEKQTLGDIQKAVIDATELSAEEIGETVSYVLSLGGRNIHTVLKAEPSHAELYAIRRAIVDDKTVVNSSVNLTLAGAVSFPDCLNGDVQQTAFGRVSVGEVYEYVEELACLTLPDATHVGEYVFYGSNASSLVAPKLQSVGTHAFSSTALTVVDLPNLTTIGEFGFSADDIKTVKLPNVTVIQNFAFWNASYMETVELTAKGEIAVGCNAIDPIFTERMNLVLFADKAEQVTGNVWTTKRPNGEDISFTFKSISFVEYDESTNTYHALTPEGLQQWSALAKTNFSTNLVLEKDIVLTGNNNFQMVGSGKNQYTGTIDGAGHSITGLHCEGMDSFGMVGALAEGGVVKNLTLVDAMVSVKGEMVDAAPVVLWNYGTVQNCHVTGNSTISAVGDSSYAGGIAGDNGEDGLIIGCTSEATVSALHAGGIVGAVYGGRVENCINKGAITGSYQAGGIMALLTNGSTVIACSNTGTVASNSYVGGIAAEMGNASLAIACSNMGTITSEAIYVGGLVGCGRTNSNNRVIGSWTVDAQEMDLETAVTENKNGVGLEGVGDYTTAFLGDATAINAKIDVMNSALAEYDYQWVAGENGAYPTLVKIVTIALKEDAQTTVYYKDNLTVDLSTLLDITEGAGEVTYTLITATGSIEGSVLSCPLQETYTVKVTVAQTATHKSAEYTFTITVTQDPATGDFDGEWVTL